MTSPTRTGGSPCSRSCAPSTTLRPRAAVLRRGLAFLEEPASFLYDGDRRPRAEELDDPFRRGLLSIARPTSRAELTWLRQTIGSLDY